MLRRFAEVSAKNTQLFRHLDLVNQTLRHLQRRMPLHLCFGSEDKTVLQDARRDKLDVLRCHEVTTGNMATEALGEAPRNTVFD